MRGLEHGLVELTDWKTRRGKTDLEPRQRGFGISAEAVVAERYGSLAGQLHGGFVVAAPEHPRCDRGRVNPIDRPLVAGQKSDGADAQEALDGPCVMAQRQHKHRIWKSVEQRRQDEEVPRRGIAECAAPLLLCNADDELCSVALHFLHVFQAVWFPVLGHQARERLRELNGQGPVCDVQSAVLARIEDRSSAPDVIADHRGSRARRAQHENRPDPHERRNCPS